ncbi:MAG: GntR family transcriptional regulator [Lachnospiraceae bacterium]|nr:GntR family transcriptional regulator [Lachnospiraceae bacterium]
MYSTQSIRVRLLAEMRTGIFSKCDRLPRETLLSENLGISRTQLRDVLGALEQEGFVTRRLGVGTLINRHVLEVKSRMDIEAEILDIIHNNGYQPEVLVLDVKEVKANDIIADKLKVKENTPIIKVSKLCLADGIPALYFQDMFEVGKIKEEYSKEDLKSPIFHFLREKCGVNTYMDLTQLKAVAADEEVANILKIPQGTPLLSMEEVDYDIEGNIVFYSKQYFVNGLFEQTVLRKRL